MISNEILFDDREKGGISQEVRENIYNESEI
jgi:hypothetical protein